MKDKYLITKESVIKILRKYHLSPFSTFKEIKTGLINPVYIINNQYVLRINTKSDKISKLKFEKEAYLYSLLYESEIPTPKCIAYDNGGEIIKEDYLLISYIDGETLTEAFKKANKDVQYILAFQLGGIAKKIHSLDINEILLRSDLFGNKKDWNIKSGLEFSEYFDLIKKERLLTEKIIKDIETVSKEFVSLGDLSKKVTLIHGDFSCNNLQVKDDKIVGVFDFEMAAIGDPYYDLQKFPINFQLGNKFDKNAFWAGYGRKTLSSEEKIRLKRFALSQGLWEIWATETKQFPFGENEIKEGTNLIIESLKT